MQNCVGPKSNGWCPCKDRDIWRHTEGEVDCFEWGRNQNDVTTGDYQGFTDQHQMPGRGERSLPRVFSSMVLPAPWFWSDVLRPVRQYVVLVFSHLTDGNFVTLKDRYSASVGQWAVYSRSSFSPNVSPLNDPSPLSLSETRLWLWGGGIVGLLQSQ